ncbi:MAG: tetratricopeptide repeat protein [Arenimonas sp.]
MSPFYFIAVLLILVALLFATYPIAKTHRKFALGLFIGLPVVTFSLYHFIGTPKALDAAFIAKNQPTQDINTAIAELEAELASSPDNLEGWLLLARTRMAMDEFDAAGKAFAKAILLEPNNPDLKTEYAEVMMRASSNRTFPAEAVKLLEQALQENPEHQRALFFLGMHYLQQDASDQAEIYLNKLIPLLDAKAGNTLRTQINIARAKQNKPPIEMAAVPETATLKVRVSLDKSLVGSLKPGAVLFVFAKAIDNAGPPVAAKKIDASQLPLELELSDADSLMPTAKLSSQEKVSLSARISIQGIANAEAGDIEADAVIVETKNTQPIEIKLSRVRK